MADIEDDFPVHGMNGFQGLIDAVESLKACRRHEAELKKFTKEGVDDK